MSVPSTEPVPTAGPADPAATDPAAAGPSDPTNPESGTGSTGTPPWGDPENFDAEKAWNLIQGLRSDKERLSARRALSDDDAAKLAEYDRLVEASKTDLERAQERAEQNEQRATRAESRAVKAEISRLADGFADPSDALDSLNVSDYVTDDGDVDVEAIKADLAELLERKPHWAKAERKGGMRPDPAQGRGSSQPVPTRTEQIAAAQAAGDMRTVLRLKAAQAAEAGTP
jgi:hypothetical protein